MLFSALSLEEQKHYYNKVQELAKSDGWIMLKRIIESEREAFFRGISAPTGALDDKLYHYNRGIIEGTYRFIDLPTKVLTELASSVMLAEAEARAKAKLTPTPATAGTP